VSQEDSRLNAEQLEEERRKSTSQRERMKYVMENEPPVLT